MLVGDFNAKDSEPCLSQFLFEMNAKNIAKKPTCFKSLSNRSCIDIVITNSSSNFQNNKAISTGLSDFHKMVVSVLKHTFHLHRKSQFTRTTKIWIELFLKENQIYKLNQQINEYKHFEQMFLEILNIHAPIKKNLLRANHVRYMRKALMKINYEKV